MNPVLVDVLRRDSVESFHRGSVVAVNAEGKTILALGDTEALIYPRSSLKPLQAIPLVESGAADHFAMTTQELALACASHSGEKIHLQVLAAWMERLGLTSSQLECGPSLPLDAKASEGWLRSGGEARRDIHNCSGKHTGMLTLATFQEQPLAGYSDYEHATQQGWMSVLTELSGVNILDMPWDKDGCGLPAIAMPLSAFARSFLPFIKSGSAANKHSDAAARIAQAMRLHPELVAGTKRCCTASMLGVDNLMAKVGAEGVFVAVAIDAGIVITLKTDDGANRAAEVMLGAALRYLGLLSAGQYEAMSPWYSPPILNSQQAVVGAVKPSKAWNDLAKP